MPDPLTPDDPGLLASLLDTARLGGFAVRNLLGGNIEGVGRNVVDLGGRAFDAILPGDWIPDVSRPEDRPEFRDLVDLGGDGILGDVANFAGDVITDPLTYIPATWVAKGLTTAGKGIEKGVSKLPEVIQKPLVEGAKKGARFVREVVGAQRVSPATALALANKQAASDLVSRVGQEASVDALSGLTERELTALGEAGLKLRLDPKTGRPVSVLEGETFDQRLQRLFADDPSLNPERMLAAAEKMRGANRAAWESGQDVGTPGGNIFFNREEILRDGNAMASPGTAFGAGEDYFPRQFSGLKESEIDPTTGLPRTLDVPTMAGQPSPIKERLDWTPQEMLDYLTKNPQVNLEFNAAKAMAARAAQQGELAGRAQIGKSLFEWVNSGEIPLPPELMAKMPPTPGKAGTSAIGPYEPTQRVQNVLLNDFRYADKDMRSAAEAIARQLPDEEAKVVLDALKGIAPRGAFTGALAKLNTYFKGPAVFGAFIPKIGSITRNLTGGLFQQFANAEARGDTLGAAKRLIPNWLGAIDDGIERLTGKRIGKNEFAEVDNAFKQAAGDPRKVLPLIKNQTMREAVEKGVLGNNFINTEQLVQEAARGGWKAFGRRFYDYPAAMFRGAEQRMRYGLFKALRGQGKSADEAAKIVQDSFYDYSISSAYNRAARDAVPFAQFIMKSIPQQAGMLRDNPWMVSILSNLKGSREDSPLMPWMEGNVNIPVGRDEQGNQQFISNLGLPVESLNFLPNPSADLAQVGRQFQQRQIGSLQPLLKTGVAAFTGEDPYFGTPFGSYSKVAGQDLGQAGAWINQLLGTGLPGATAVSGLLGMGSKVTDDRTSLADKAVNLLTGAKVTSVDPDVALRQQLTNLLSTRPDIPSYRQYYNPDRDPEIAAILQSLEDAKDRVKAKKKEAAAVQ